jgi:ribosomal protein L40E
MTNIIETNSGIRCGMCGAVNWPTATSCMRCTATLDKRPARKALPYTMGRDLSFSQRLAHFFAIVDYVLLIPAIYGLLLSLVVIVDAPHVTFLIIGWFTAGCFLLRGFFRHSRGRLSDSQVKTLWRATMGYNLVDLVAMWLIALKSGQVIFFYFGLWPLAVVVFSVMALVSESRRTS